MKSSLRRPSALSALVVLLAVAGCATERGRAAAPAPPTPGAREAGLCRALQRELPRTVDGRERRETGSELTAVWGPASGPSIVLRCGVPRPEVLTPGSAHYSPTTDAAEIDGVDWVPERQPDGSVRCTTQWRAAFVEVTLPKEVTGGAGDISALTDLADAVKKALPFGAF
ncbi:DUF3515 domain-containing protein [Streptomyces gamaensis]|uniref:DUF3515 domain-containing protein n=1 Tax=Streptomyces gamaensis TaxID=1763542 RepID=A0ABW0Z2C0_9ACTN